MIIVKSEREIELMRRAGKITAAARALAGEMVKPGVTTREIDKAVFHFIRSQGAEPSFLNYNGYPASVCVSVNDEIIHGLPGPGAQGEQISSAWTWAHTSAASTATAQPLTPAERFPKRHSG